MTSQFEKIVTETLGDEIPTNAILSLFVSFLKMQGIANVDSLARPENEAARRKIAEIVEDARTEHNDRMRDNPKLTTVEETDHLQATFRRDVQKVVDDLIVVRKSKAVGPKLRVESAEPKDESESDGEETMEGVTKLVPATVQQPEVKPGVKYEGDERISDDVVRYLEDVLKGSDLEDEDLNGDTFTGTHEGEVLDLVPLRIVLVPVNMDVPLNPLDQVKHDKQKVKVFIMLNVHSIITHDVTITLKEAAVLAYHRYLSLKSGLISPVWKAADYFVKYNECVWATQSDYVRTQEWARKLSADQTNLLNKIPNKVQIRESFADRVSIVAFVFRARAHHWTPEYDELYQRVWNKCRYAPEILQAQWKNISVVALHAIMPVVLEKFWATCVSEGKVNGTLTKRFNSAPAGAAGPYVIQQGIADILQIAPGLPKQLKTSINYLAELMPKLASHRYAGSVNHRYYGVERITINEQPLGAAAAVIKSAIDGLAPNDPLGKSAALSRIARYAPVTGAVLSRAIGNIATRPEVVTPLLTE